MARFFSLVIAYVVALLWVTPLHAASDALVDWQAENAEDQRRIDHSLWQQFLDLHVSASDDGVNRVDYRSAGAVKSRALLNTYIKTLSEIDPRSYHRDTQMAYWINLYNALTIEVVLRYPKKKSIRRMGESFLAFGPWDDEIVTVAGQPLTLNDIEHRILRPLWQDHRIHFAVNCASIGCPNLSRTAFRRDNLEMLLTAGETDYLNHPRGAQLNQGNLQLSSIFKWYQEDFGSNEQAVVSYLGKHLPWLADHPAFPNFRITYEYDWQLNSLPQD